ncbi:MAG TPA: hypothetical protein VGP70_03365 [Actinomadura sp.]|jgi:hypothetical protein|nr:hypothetical protein [Actinomadura sp.]
MRRPVVGGLELDRDILVVPDQDQQAVTMDDPSYDGSSMVTGPRRVS